MSKVIITGACGFIGSCLTRRLLAEGCRVVGIDNLSRRGTELNADELEALDGFELRRLDIADADAVYAAFDAEGEVDAVFHLAGQVAVTSSYENRQRDFASNAAGSFHVIEAVKRFTPSAWCFYSSTNKVYGHLRVHVPVGLTYPLDPYTPYGVSKAVGELYFSEYGRSEIGLETCCLRQSCIYGHHQYGVEDQGWVAWFAIANLFDKPVTIYGDGNQVRDLLFIDDLLDLYLECWRKRLTGVYPIGGGSANSISLAGGLEMISEITGREFSQVAREPTRPGDQPYFVADLSWSENAGLDWAPKTGVREGLSQMIAWIKENETAIRRVIG